MLKLPTRFVIGILTIGILVGAGTTATVVSAGLKPFNLALAQLRAPFVAQQPQVQAPSQQQPVTTASSSGGGSFGPSCVGCVTTQNLANGAVTTPKIAPGAVSLTVQEVQGDKILGPGESGTAVANCPAGTVLTGGGFDVSNPGLLVKVSDGFTQDNQWQVEAINTSGGSFIFDAQAFCTTIHP